MDKDGLFSFLCGMKMLEDFIKFSKFLSGYFAYLYGLVR